MSEEYQRFKENFMKQYQHESPQTNSTSYNNYPR